MEKTGIFYGSSRGHTGWIAGLIQAELDSPQVVLRDIGECSAKDLAENQVLILGTSTWENGDLQEDWYDFLPALDEIDLSGKRVALFGVGDSARYPDNFGDAVGKLFDEVEDRGATVIGTWPANEYDFLDSEALRQGRLVGLLVDTADDMGTTRRRIEQWVEKIRPALDSGR